MMSITDPAMVQKTLRKVERHGVARTLHLACLKTTNRVVSFRILRGLHVEKAELAILGKGLRGVDQPVRDPAWYGAGLRGERYPPDDPRDSKKLGLLSLEHQFLREHYGRDRYVHRSSAELPNNHARLREDLYVCGVAVGDPVTLAALTTHFKGA